MNSRRGNIRGGKDGKSSHFIKSIMSYYVTENHTENEMLARKLKLWWVCLDPFSSFIPILSFFKSFLKYSSFVKVLIRIRLTGVEKNLKVGKFKKNVKTRSIKCQWHFNKSKKGEGKRYGGSKERMRAIREKLRKDARRRKGGSIFLLVPLLFREKFHNLPPWDPFHISKEKELEWVLLML